MEGLIIIIALFIIVSAIKFSLKISNKKQLKSFEAHLKKLESFKINLNKAKIDGFNWYETVPVDTYGTELDPSDDTFYRKSMFESFRGKYHKDKQVTKFSTKIILPVKYNHYENTFHLKIPLEHTIVRMKFYLQKEITVYVEDEQNFIFDFNFLECDGISYIIIP